MSYELIVPCVIADTPAGKLYIYKPARLPEDTDKEQVKTLLEDGLIRKSTEVATEVFEDPAVAAERVRQEQSALDAAAAQASAKEGARSSTGKS